jgi:hypothetical protein
LRQGIVDDFNSALNATQRLMIWDAKHSFILFCRQFECWKLRTDGYLKALADNQISVNKYCSRTDSGLVFWFQKS